MIRIVGDRFCDEHGRRLMLRGVNLGGSSKVPTVPDGATWRPDSLRDPASASFVGRPFPLDEADEHFGRLAGWGFTFLRLLTTWEAVEHAGRGTYDEAYLAYLRAIVEKAAEHGISIFIDPHQDVWSRFTGGDGAPAWTLEAVGFDLAALDETGAAITHQWHGDPFPKMIWPTNYGKLANLTMWTLFFGGDLFAPGLRIGGIAAQEYLQGAYIAAMARVAEALVGLPNVVGFDTLNEPDTGLIGCADLSGTSAFPVRLGAAPTPLQAFALGEGIPADVAVFALGPTGFRRRGSERLNADGRRAWTGDSGCPWHAEGVWDTGPDGAPRVVRPDHFTRVDGRTVDFGKECFVPFVRRYAEAVRAHLPNAIVFVEEPAGTDVRLEPGSLANCAYAPHWYDGATLMRKTYAPWLGADAGTGKPVFGRRRVAKSFALQIGRLVERGRTAMGGVPTLIGECGIPFDLDGRRAYRTGDFSGQARALDATMRALEANRASFTLWNYTADNTNERGDGWNDEDLSLFSRDQMRGDGSTDDDGRALASAVRPYPVAVPGEVLSVSFDHATGVFECAFRIDRHVDAPAEFFVPTLHYPGGANVTAPNGAVALDGQRLTYTPDRDLPVHEIVLRPVVGA